MKIDNNTFFKEIKDHTIQVIFVQKTTKDYLLLFPESKWLKLAIFLPYFLSIVTVVGYAIHQSSIVSLLGIIVYLFVPAFVGKQPFIYTMMTILGIYGFQTKWIDIIIVTLLPGLMCYIGILSYQRLLEWLMMNKILSDIGIAKQLEKEGYIIFEKQGQSVTLITCGGNNETNLIGNPWKFCSRN